MNDRPQPEPFHATLRSECVYQGRVIGLRVDEVSLPSGGTLDREFVTHPGAVAIVALLEDGEVLLVEQWRHAVGKTLYEIPAGTLSPGEAPLSCADRELGEETGYTAARMEPLVSFYSAPGFCTERLHVFLATGLTPGEQHTEEDEDIRVTAVPWEQALAMCLDGSIEDAKTIAGLLCADRRLNRT